MTEIYQSYSPVYCQVQLALVYLTISDLLSGCDLECIFTIFHSFRHEILLKTKQSGLINILFHSMAISYMYE